MHHAFPTKMKSYLMIERKNHLKIHSTIIHIKKRSCLSTQPFSEIIYMLFKESANMLIFHDIVLIDVLYGVYNLGNLNSAYYKIFFRHLYYVVFHRGLRHDHLLH